MRYHNSSGLESNNIEMNKNKGISPDIWVNNQPLNSLKYKK